MAVQASSAGSSTVARWGWVCLVAGLLGLASAVFLIAIDPVVGEDRYSYPLSPEGFVAIQVFFFVHHLGLLGGLYALWRSGAVGTSRLGRWGSWGSMAGMALLSVTELVAISGARSAYPSARTDLLDGLYGMSSILIGVTLIMTGIAVIRLRRWQGWARIVPLALGVYVFVPMIPGLMGPHLLARLTIGGWMLGFAALGYALVKHSEPSTPRPVRNGSFAPRLVLENTVDLDHPHDEVFHYLSDLRNEIEWNPAMKSVELLTGEPIDASSRYRASWSGSGGAHVVEYLEYDPPRRWTSIMRSPRLIVGFEGQVTPADQGARLAVRMEVQPLKGTRVIFPLLRRVLQRQEKANMAYIEEVFSRRSEKVLP